MPSILIATDKFKGSISALEACKALATGLKNNLKNECHVHPMADGGEVSLEVLKHFLPLEFITLATVDSLGSEITVQVATSEDKAFIETADVIGLQLLKPSDRNPMTTSSYGLGVLIAQLIKTEVKEIHLFLGGSATNDGGIGMAKALGYRF